MGENIKKVIEEILSVENPGVEKLRRIYKFIKEPTYLSRYRSLIHLTHLDNLESILEEGLVPTKYLKENGYLLNGKEIEPGYGYSYLEDTVCMFYTNNTNNYICEYFEEMRNEPDVGVVISPIIKSDEKFIDEKERENLAPFLENEVNFKGKIDPGYIEEIIYYEPRVRFEYVLPRIKKFKRPLIKILKKTTRYSWIPDIGLNEDLSKYDIYGFVVRFYDELKEIDSTIDVKIDKEELVVNYGKSVEGIEEKIVKGENIPEIERLIDRFNLKKPRILAKILEEKIYDRCRPYYEGNGYLFMESKREERKKIAELWLEGREKDNYGNFVSRLTEGAFYNFGYGNIREDEVIYELTHLRNLSDVDPKDALRSLIKEYSKGYGGYDTTIRVRTYPFAMELCEYLGLEEEYNVFNKKFREFVEQRKVNDKKVKEFLTRGKELSEKVLEELGLKKHQ